MAPEHPPYRVEEGVALVELRLQRPGQLFDLLDPSPFRERELDAQAEEWIVESVRELGRVRPLKLVLYLPADQPVDPDGLRDALHNHFRYRLWSTGRRYETFRRDGWIKLAIGLSFLFACLVLRTLLVRVVEDGLWAEVMQEGLLILGWVAMWGPIEALLYEWWPIRREAALYRLLSEIDVEVRGVRPGTT